MALTIGYLVPEFPGQTHAFFWRELHALRELGITGDLVSTRRPEGKLISHAWAPGAIERTTYLFPLSFAAAISALATILRAGPRGWWRCLGAIRRGRGKLRLIALAVMGAQLVVLARRRGWRHVHVHSCADSAHIALFAHLLTALPYSLTLHGALDNYGPNQDLKWRHAAFAFTITRRLLKEVRASIGQSLPPIVELAPMGVDVRQFGRTRPYQPYAGKGPCRIFCCGRLNAGKGHDDLIGAVAALHQRGIDAELHIAGEDDSATGACRKGLEQLITKHALDGKVKLLGAVSEEVVRDELEAAHLFALASHFEALGVAIMEAMAMLVPVVVTDVGGVHELVEDGVDGVRTPARDPERMAAAMENVLQDAELARRLSEAGRDKILRSFDSSVSAKVLARNLGVKIA